MQIIEVVGSDLVGKFLMVNAIMNSSNPAYIRALDNEVKDVFDPAKNKNFKYGTAKRWIAIWITEI